MCIGFVACDKDEGTTQGPETISIFDFAKESTFSFGKFVEGEVMNVGYRDLHNERYDETASSSAVNPSNTKYPALFLENDLYFDDMINALQTIYDEKVEGYIRAGMSEPLKQALAEQHIANHIERNRVAFARSKVMNNLTVSHVLNTNVGEKCKLEEYEDPMHFNGYVLKDVVKGDYTYRYMISFYGDTDDYQDFGSLYLVFVIYVLNSNKKIVERFNALTEMFWYEGDSQESALLKEDGFASLIYILNQLTTDDMYELGRPYFEVIEEVIDAWLDDPRGQAYINKYYS
jgi:hypothetical protein